MSELEQMWDATFNNVDLVQYCFMFNVCCTVGSINFWNNIGLIFKLLHW